MNASLEESLPSHPPSDCRPDGRRPYHPPCLEVGSMEDLIEILGPAQAGYGGTGFPS